MMAFERDDLPRIGCQTLVIFAFLPMRPTPMEKAKTKHGRMAERSKALV